MDDGVQDDQNGGSDVVFGPIFPVRPLPAPTKSEIFKQADLITVGRLSLFTYGSVGAPAGVYSRLHHVESVERKPKVAGAGNGVVPSVVPIETTAAKRT